MHNIIITIIIKTIIIIMKSTKVQTLSTILLIDIWIEKHLCMYWVNTMVRKLSCIEPTPKVRALFQHILH